MCIKNSVLPQANIYSSKKLFDKLEDRNQKRIAQIVRRKNALLSKNKNLNTITKDKSSDQMITPSTQEISTNTINNNNLDLSKSYIKEENYYQKILFSSRPPAIERFLSSFKIKNKNKNTVNISSNFNIVDEDLSEKEVNISNLNDNDNYFDYINEKEKSKNKNKKNIFNEKNKNLTRNEEKNQKETNNICQRNKYAIEFLSSSLDSFIELKNKLVRKAKYNKNYFTLSYSQALFLDYNNSSNYNNYYNSNYINTDYKKYEKERIYNYEVNDIIKEENESYSPKTNNKLFIEQMTTMRYMNRKNNKTSIKINNKRPNDSFFKTSDNYLNGHKNINIKKYSFNKKALINNCKLKIPKIKLSIDLKNKRKISDNINENNNNNKNNKFIKKIDVNQKNKDKDKEEKKNAPKFLESKPHIEEEKNKKEKEKENNKNSNKNKNKSKKILKRVKLKI